MFGGVQMYDYSLTLPTSFTRARRALVTGCKSKPGNTAIRLHGATATGAGGNNAHYRRYINTYSSQSGDLA